MMNSAARPSVVVSTSLLIRCIASPATLPGLTRRKLEGILLALQNVPSQKPFLTFPQDVMLVFGDGREQVADDPA
jgi:hypothetical protein